MIKDFGRESGVHEQSLFYCLTKRNNTKDNRQKDFAIRGVFKGDNLRKRTCTYVKQKNLLLRNKDITIDEDVSLQ